VIRGYQLHQQDERLARTRANNNREYTRSPGQIESYPGALEGLLYEIGFELGMSRHFVVDNSAYYSCRFVHTYNEESESRDAGDSLTHLENLHIQGTAQIFDYHPRTGIGGERG
jgi:hypothetical protein